MSSDGVSEASVGRSRRRWRLALCLYGALVALDTGAHLFEDSRTGRGIDYADVTVAFAAGLFWPADFVAHVLLNARH